MASFMLTSPSRSPGFNSKNFIFLVLLRLFDDPAAPEYAQSRHRR
jgi:hypothetical protein